VKYNACTISVQASTANTAGSGRAEGTILYTKGKCATAGVLSAICKPAWESSVSQESMYTSKLFMNCAPIRAMRRMQLLIRFTILTRSGTHNNERERE
jgi:hypothetical protein